MSNFVGGSAYAMVQQISEGFHLVTERSFKRLSHGDLHQLSMEIDKKLRSIRAEVAPQRDIQETQLRNRRLQRLTSALMMLRSYRQKR